MTVPKVHRNANGGVQIEWRGVLLTLTPNEHHGLMGSICVKEGGRTKVLEFHGGGPDAMFPVQVHKETDFEDLPT